MADSENEKTAVFVQMMFEEIVAAGFEFTDTSSMLNFVNEEMGQPVNYSDIFMPSCSPVRHCVVKEKFERVFGDVMGRYMRNRLRTILPVLAVFAVISIVSNVLGIRAVVGIRSKLPRHWVLMNLSLSDCLLAPLNAIKVTSEVLAYSAFDELFRGYFNSIWQVFFLLCPLSLFFLALDNVVAVVAPFYYERRSGSGARNLMLMVGAATWFCIVLLIVLLRVFKVHDSQTVQLIVATVLLMIIAITVTLYLALAMKAEIYRRKLMVVALPSSVMSNDNQQRELLRSRMKTTATTLSIVLTLAGFWSPFIAYLLISDEAKFSNVPFYINFLCASMCLFQFGTAVDPIVYCCRMVEVRRSLISSVVPSSCRDRFSKADTFEPRRRSTVTAVQRRSEASRLSSDVTNVEHSVTLKNGYHKKCTLDAIQSDEMGEHQVPLKYNEVS